MQRKELLAKIATAAMGLGIAVSAHATPATYAFSGVGGGNIREANGITVLFSGEFTFDFTADTTAIDGTSFPGFYSLSNVGGTFTEGAYSATLAPAIINLNPNTAGSGLVYAFNAGTTNAVGERSTALFGYDLSTSIGPVPGDSLFFFGSSSFITADGGLVFIGSIDSLTFTAAVPAAVPEPATVALLTLGLAGLGFSRRKQ